MWGDPGDLDGTHPPRLGQLEVRFPQLLILAQYLPLISCLGFLALISGRVLPF